MTNAAVPLRSTEEVARTVGRNTKSILAGRGRTLEWLASEIGISVDSILKAFGSHVDTWLVLDLSFYLEVAPDALLEVPA